MKLASKTISVALASTVLLGLSSSAFSDGRGHEGHNGSSIPATYGTTIPAIYGTTISSVTRLGSTLTAATGSTATGTIQYAYSATGAGILQAKVHLPVSSISSIIDSNTAVTDTITLTFSTGATYTLAITDLEFTYSGTTTTPTETAGYSLAVSDNGTTYTVALGSGSETALPVLVSGNTVSVTVGTSTTPILTGTLAISTGR